MESRYFSLPGQRNYEYGYEFAYELAGKQLAALDDIEQQCLSSGALYQEADSRKAVTLKYLNQSYQIALPDIDVSLIDSKDEVSIRDRVLILHYFTRAKGTPLTNRLIAYKELPEGINYSPTFSKRAIKPLLDHFSQEPHRLIDVAERLGGRRADYGDVAVTIDAFSRVPVTLVLWQGDEEFAAEGGILFDSTIPDYLATEDITVLCEIISWRLVKYLKQSQK